MSIPYGAVRRSPLDLCREHTRKMVRGMKCILESQVDHPVRVRLDESADGADIEIGPFRDKRFTVSLWFYPEQRRVDAKACLYEGREKRCRTMHDIPVAALSSPAALFPWLVERRRHHNADDHIERLIAETPSAREQRQSYQQSLREFRDVHQPITRYTAQMFGIQSLLQKDAELADLWHQGTPVMIPVHIPPVAMFGTHENKHKVAMTLVTKLHTGWIYDPTGGRRPNFMGRVADRIVAFRPDLVLRNMTAVNGMLRRYLIGGPYRLAVDRVQTDSSGLLTVYMSSYTPGNATHPELKAAAIQALEEMFRQIAQESEIYRKMIFGATEVSMPQIAIMVESDWRNDRRKYESVQRRQRDPEITLTEGDAWMKHCVAKVYAQHKDLSRAFAICTSQGQKSGYYEKGTKTLTPAGKTRARSKAAQKGHQDVLTSYETAKELGALQRRMERLRRRRRR